MSRDDWHGQADKLATGPLSFLCNCNQLIMNTESVEESMSLLFQVQPGCTIFRIPTGMLAFKLLAAPHGR